MTERIKDFIYDCSDIILTLVIIGCMFLVISWKVTDIMGIPLYPEAAETSPITISDDIDNVEEDNNISKDDIILEDDIIIEPEVLPNESDVETKEIIIEIPSGTTGSGIAKILQQNGLIDDTSKFLNRVEDLQLTPKLRAGKFNLKSNNSIDEIIHIITNK